MVAMGVAYARGTILIYVLMLVASLSVLLGGMRESAILQIKMTQAFKHSHERAREAAVLLLQREKRLEETGECGLSCEWIEFVPDELLQSEIRGVDYYRLWEEGITSTIAVRREGSPRSFVWPSLRGVDEKYFSEEMVIGSDPEQKGVRIYRMLVLKEAEHSIIEGLQVTPQGEERVIYRLDEGSMFGMPLLWHGYLIVEKPLQHKIAIYEAHSGKKIREGDLSIDFSSDYPLCSKRPVVWLRAAREPKRKVLVFSENARWSTEIELDSERLGVVVTT